MYISVDFHFMSIRDDVFCICVLVYFVIGIFLHPPDNLKCISRVSSVSRMSVIMSGLAAVSGHLARVDGVQVLHLHLHLRAASVIGIPKIILFPIF